jgi:ATP-dependent DNA helicase PIF1
VNQQTTNINSLDDYYSNYKKTRDNLVRIQNDQLNSFLNQEQRKVLDLTIQGKSIFYTGSAGTGKSFLLQRIIRSLELLNKKIAVTAPTGIAAVNVGGITIHSFSGIGTFGDTSPPEDLFKKISEQKSQT